MGLDTYARPEMGKDISAGDKFAFAMADIQLCGGLLSGSGCDGSFRGKVYSEWVEEVTGESLYQQWISPVKVQVMYRKMEGYAKQHKLDEEGQSLLRFLQVCVERNLGLYGWW